jgi:hypothetical protein
MVEHSKTTVAAAQAALSKLSPQLLLLGLRLLANNNTAAGKVACAVVQPRPHQGKSGGSGPTSPAGSDAPGKNQQSPPSSPEQNQQVPQSAGRKRRREERQELSDEEKREKRKLMNRIAAQNARDRKKNYVDDLERRVAELEAKNETLQQENQALRQKTDSLVLEKKQLETQLLHQHPYENSPSSSTTTILSGSSLGQEGRSESGSAVPFTSLQQKQILETLFAQVMVTVNLILWLACCKTTPGLSTTPSRPVDHMIPWVHSCASHMTRAGHGENLRRQVWWGPQQSTWNPIAT